MNRKSFIITASTIAIGLPVAYYIKKHRWYDNPVAKPDELSNFCNEKVLREMGVLYRSQVSTENTKEKLKDLILTDDAGKKITNSDKLVLAEFINQKTQQDFLAYRTIILKGWVISITEARQCALLSLT
jgi:hypothetical protein